MEDRILATKKQIVINIAKMLVIVSALYAASYAWFYRGEAIDINPLTLKTEALGTIEISLDNGTSWNDIAAFNIDPDFIFNNEITGDGVIFNKPNMKNVDGSPSSFVEAVANTDYLEFEALFRSNKTTGLFLDKDSIVRPAVGTASYDLIGTGVTRKSAFGDYSKDLIAGAVRVGFVEGSYTGGVCNYNTSPSLVWAPNKGYEILYSNGVYSASTNSYNLQSYEYIKVLDSTTFYNEKVTNLKDMLSASKSLDIAGGDPILTSLASDFSIGCVKVNVWIEGNDRDADYSLKGGLFEIGLKFIGIDKNYDIVAPSVSANLTTNTITGYASGMEYSKDYGNYWIPYEINSNPVFNSGDTVYVRKSETMTTFASTYTELNF